MQTRESVMKKIILICLFGFSSSLISDTIIYKKSYGALGNSVENYSINDVQIIDFTKKGVTYTSPSSRELLEISLKQIVLIKYDNGRELKQMDIKQLLKDRAQKQKVKIKKSKNLDISYIDENWSNETKMLFYHKEKKSPENAIFYELSSFIPFMNLGYAYTDNWKKGLMWDGIIIGSLLLSESKALRGDCLSIWDDQVVPDLYCQQNPRDYEYEDSTGKKILNLTAVSILIYKYINVYQLAEEYNDNLYNSLFNEPRPYFSLETTTKSINLAFNIPIK